MQVVGPESSSKAVRSWPENDQVPQWSAFSDPYTGRQVAPGVTGSSWFTALFEIAADTAFGVAGLRAMRGPAVVA